jgi:hypothetical protein
LEQQQHDREQLFDCDDESNGAANDAAAEHHGFRGDVNTAAVAVRVDAAAGSAKIPIVTRRQKNVPAPLAPGLEPLEFR